MEFRVSKRGAGVVCCHLMLLVGAACLALGILLGWWLAAGLLFAVCLLLVVPFYYWHLRSCWLRCATTHLTVRRGVLFLSTRRLPLRFITGCHVIRLPLARLTNTCLLLIFSSGCFTVMDGVLSADATALCARIMHER